MSNPAGGTQRLGALPVIMADDVPFIPMVRDFARATGAHVRIADLTDAARLRDALYDACCIVCCSHARHATAVIAAAPPDARLVFLGSTREITRFLSVELATLEQFVQTQEPGQLPALNSRERRRIPTPTDSARAATGAKRCYNREVASEVAERSPLVSVCIRGVASRHRRHGCSGP